MKKYRLKEEVKKYIHSDLHDMVSKLSDFEYFEITLEALEEVPQRIELVIHPTETDNCWTWLLKNNGQNWTDQEKDLCEKALNGELLDIDSLDDFQFKRSFIDFMIGEKGDTKDKDFVASTLNALKQYLKEK